LLVVLALLALLCNGRRRAAARGAMISTIDKDSAREAYQERLDHARALPDRLKQHLAGKNTDVTREGISLMPIIIGDGGSNIAIDGLRERSQSTTHL